MQNKSKTIDELNLQDDFLFAKVMTDKEICRKVLEKILNISIREVVLVTTQHTIDILYEGKGIRLDVYVNDENGTVYNVEMQRGKRKELPKRSRFYQGNIDLDLITSGKPYTSLRKSFIIFICTFDPFQEGRHLYTFENRCLEDPSIALGDETTKVFLNTKGTMDDVDADMKEFLTYIENTTDSFASQASSTLVKEIHQKVVSVKQDKETEVEYMTLMQRDRENIEYGRTALLIALMQKKLRKSKTLEQIIEELEEPEDQLRPIYDAIMTCGIDADPETIYETWTNLN